MQQPDSSDGGAAQVPVDSPVQCVECGYSLRTLAVDGRCPECGHAVGDSLEAYANERPPALVAVGWWFIVAGVLAVGWMIEGVVIHDRLVLPLGIIQIPLGMGLWRGVPSARVWAMIIIWFHLLTTPVVVAVSGWLWATGRLPGGDVQLNQVAYQGYLVAWLPVSWWQFRVLMRPHLRRVFDVPYWLAR